MSNKSLCIAIILKNTAAFDRSNKRNDIFSRFANFLNDYDSIYTTKNIVHLSTLKLPTSKLDIYTLYENKPPINSEKLKHKPDFSK